MHLTRLEAFLYFEAVFALPCSMHDGEVSFPYGFGQS